jgi:hypothetical protein
MFFFPVTESEMEKVVKVLKNKVWAGIDKILYYVVKQCIKLLKKRLANIYNASLELEIFPDQIKIAKVAPFYKKEDKRDFPNYRPIVLLSVFSKFPNKFMYVRLMAFIEGNRVLIEAQHGFRTKKSTETALQIFIKSVQKAIETNKQNWKFLDLMKAYDVLNHKVLLSKLYSYGIRVVTNLWFESYLSHQKQYVETSSMNQVTYKACSKKDRTF